MTSPFSLSRFSIVKIFYFPFRIFIHPLTLPPSPLPTLSFSPIPTFSHLTFPPSPLLTSPSPPFCFQIFLR